MNVPNIESLPPEIVQEIVTILPSLHDVLSLALVDRHFWSVLATPVVHAKRVFSRGWDVDPWIEEYTMIDTYTEPRSLLTWRKIDFLHEELEGFFEQEALPTRSSPCLTLGTAKRGSTEVQKGLVSLKLMNLATAAVRHHRKYNLIRLSSSKYKMAFSTMTHSLWDGFPHSTSMNFIDSLFFAGRFMWLVSDLSQRAMFNAASMLCTGEEMDNRVRGIAHTLAKKCFLLSKATREEHSISILLRETFPHRGCIPRWFQGISCLPDASHPSLSDADARAIQAKRSCICAAALVLLWSHLLYNPEFSPSLFPAQPPELPLAIAGAHRDWLDPLSFPLSALQSYGRSWVGYYSTPLAGKLRISSPMIITLTKTQELDASGSAIHFRGVGLDSIRSFQLTGTISGDGTVTATKLYEHGTRWNWNGMVLPWAMVGLWGNKNSWGGWWWIWPNERCL